MKPQSALVLALLVVLSLSAMPITVADPGGSPSAEVAAFQPDAGVLFDHPYVGDDNNPSTQGTIGYVEGIRYDDELPVDDRDDAVVDEAELEAVVHRSMARVEVIRGLTFYHDVPVEVVARDEYAAESGDRFADLTAEDRLFENVRLEALFMADRNTEAVDEYEALYGDAVAGYYDPADDRIVLVSNDVENPQLDEVTLGHELLHALQDQHFDLQRYDRETTNQDHAKLGIIEGDAVWVDTRYELRCGSDWECVIPTSVSDPPDEFNIGLYLTLFQPYNDGPDFVDALRVDGDWDDVNDVYENPPTSSSEIIRPGEEREPAEIDVEDASSDDWERLEPSTGPDYDVFGEATIAAVFMHQTLESPRAVGVQHADIFDFDGSLNYDHAVTDGWAGDEFVVYAAGETPDEAAYVWQTEWLDEAEAEAFHEGYLELLDHHDAEPNGDGSGAFVIDDGFPGAYHVEHDGETVTVVRAPSIDDLTDVHGGIVVDDEWVGDDDGEDDDGEDENHDDDGGGDGETRDGTDDVEGGEASEETDDREDGTEQGDERKQTADQDDGGAETDDPVPGFGLVVALCALLGGCLIVVRRR